MKFDQINHYLLGLDGVTANQSMAEGVTMYNYQAGESSTMIAVVAPASKPLRISLRCDRKLARMLRERYETVLPGENLSKKDWNTIICSGQLSDDEIFDLARHSYELARAA